MTVPTGSIQAWIDDDVEPTDAADLTALLAAATELEAGTASAGTASAGTASAAADELRRRFSGPLTFGTAGLRGPLRAGPNGMNATVVRRAAAGLAAWLTARPELGRVVVVGYDARHGSARFARDSAAVLAAAGLDSRLLPAALPTPVLAYAVRKLGAAGGVMVTASHNPRADNGYKVYGPGGAQIIAPTDREIETAIRAVGPSRLIPMSDAYQRLDDELTDAYVRAVAALVDAPARPLRIVHTAMHGVGTDVLARVFERAGFPVPVPVAEQARPDPDFPTLPFPNPEEPGALDLAVRTAIGIDADLIIASDPDADRCAVAVPVPISVSADGWRMLRGDELGVLLADALLVGSPATDARATHGRRGTYATTIVSSTLLGRMARRHGVGYAETLTGFKWIMRAAPDLSYGYEEALGYAVAPDLVRDKDGISAALVIAHRAASLATSGSSLWQRLDELALEYGRHATGQISIRVADPALIASAMGRLRATPPATLLDHQVNVADLLPAADVLTLSWSGGRVVVRPSGTEPKLKAYLEVVLADASRAEADELLARLDRQIRTLLNQ